MTSIKVIVIFGPTSSGKTALSLSIADYISSKYNLEAEIISADSRQIYKGMNIGTAKVSGQIQKQYKHHFLSILSPTQQYTTDQFSIEARTAIQKIMERGHVPIIVGGTGTYVMSVVGENHINKHSKVSNNYSSIMLIPAFERKSLYRKIETNIEKMFEDGLYNEVKNLVRAHNGVPKQIGKTDGYREFVEYCKEQNRSIFKLNTNDLEKIKYRIKIDTKKYAMHQSSWLPKMNNYHVVAGSQEAIRLVDSFFKKSANNV
jgi:tRNA A37 N6-isopentenylltransferase MiaA